MKDSLVFIINFDLKFFFTIWTGLLTYSFIWLRNVYGDLTRYKAIC